MRVNENLKDLLIIKYGKIERQVVLTDEIYSIGRHSSNKIVIDNARISRVHCTILPVKYEGRNQQELYWIIDGDLQGNRSANGIYVNNNKSLSHELKSGDVVKLGNEEVLIHYLVGNIKNYDEQQKQWIETSSKTDIDQNLKNHSCKSASVVSEKQEKISYFPTTITQGYKEEEENLLYEFICLVQEKKHKVQLPIIKINFQEEIVSCNDKYQKTFPELNLSYVDNPFTHNLYQKLSQCQQNFLVREIKYKQKQYTQYARLSRIKAEIESYILSFQDKLKTEQKLRESEEKYRAIVRQISEGIILVDPITKQIVEANNAYCTLVGYQSEELTSLTIYDLIATDPEIHDSIIELIRHRGLNLTQESLHRHCNRSLVNVEVNISSIYYGVKEFICYAVTDVTQRKLAEDMLRYQACHDSLTELANRNFFNERLTDAIADAQKSNAKLAVIFIDLDRFKNINDTLGHDIGDLFLQQVACKLKNCLGKNDLIARWGGDEFTILLPSIHSKKVINQVADTILEAFQKPLQILDYQLYCHLSMGIAIYPQDGSKAETLVKNADTALYRSKEQGGNDYQYYIHSMSARKKELLQLESYLYEAIKFNQLHLYYQPQINFKTRELIGMEALIRWHHPQLGTVSPNDFIPLAEQTGFISAIGKWALFNACRQNKKWQDLGLPPIKISVNISPRQCQLELLSLLREILYQTQLPPQYLELEITENSIIVHPELTKNILQEVRQMGVGISMDDFGTGYSSLGYLKKFPFQTIKIDQSFVRELKNETEDLAIISAVVTLGKGFDLQIIAEGVETSEQLKLLTNSGCFIVQGYLFSHPLSTDEATNFMKLFRKNGLSRFPIYG